MNQCFLDRTGRSLPRPPTSELFASAALTSLQLTLILTPSIQASIHPSIHRERESRVEWRVESGEWYLLLVRLLISPQSHQSRRAEPVTLWSEPSSTGLCRPHLYQEPPAQKRPSPLVRAFPPVYSYSSSCSCSCRSPSCRIPFSSRSFHWIGARAGQVVSLLLSVSVSLAQLPAGAGGTSLISGCFYTFPLLEQGTLD